MINDYTYLTKYTLAEGEVRNLDFDLFLSAYDTSDRVLSVYGRIGAARKLWIVHPEYGFEPAETANLADAVFLNQQSNEVESWLRIWDEALQGASPNDVKVCIDISGFMRPFIAVLPLILKLVGFREVKILYSDPKSYAAGIATTFSRGPVGEVRQVPGLEGTHTTSTNPADALIIGAGYDEALIRAVANFKRSAGHFILLGLPSLQPHMYQESQLNLAKASESIHNYASHSFLHAPASDPFVTAGVLSQLVTDLRSARPEINIYLSPVGPKAQVLGFGLYFACEARENATSMIFPYAPAYGSASASGVSRVHLYDLDLSWVIDSQ